MHDLLPHRALYAAFDRYPSAKGAATHIARMATTLFDALAGGLLFVLGGEDLPWYQREGNVEIVRFGESVPNFLERALRYGSMLERTLDRIAPTLQLAHFRDPWSAVPILRRRSAYRTVYEVNGLPSIELPYAYSGIAPATLDKIRAAERFAIEQSDAIVTPSHTIARNLARLGADPAKITVIPNGADIPAVSAAPAADSPKQYILYFGALQRWQGLDVLLRAFARLADLPDLHLAICASGRHRGSKVYARLAERLGIAERVVWRFALNKQELGGWIAGARLSVAPLVECSRNVEQGCAPLKILESMAHAVPVVASDLGAVREIVADGTEGCLVRPDRPADLARAIRVLLEYPDRAREFGERGRQRIAAAFTWERSTDALRGLYARLLSEHVPALAVPGGAAAADEVAADEVAHRDADGTGEGSILASS